MRKWAIVLHFYQPPVQDLRVTKQVVESSYIPVLELLEAHPNISVTLNISACLLKQLNKLKRQTFFEKIKLLYSRGQIELLNGPAMHPVIPLISKRTLERQFRKTDWVYKDLLGLDLGKGIFPPELAIDAKNVDELKKYGEYFLVDETGLKNKYTGEGLISTPTVVNVMGMKVFVNNRIICDVLRSYTKVLSGQKLADWIKQRTTENQVIVSVNDVEAFGHHYEERLMALKELFEGNDFEFVKLEQLSGMKGEDVEYAETSWQNLPEDKHRQGAFWLWRNSVNHLQTSYWELAEMVEKIYNEENGHTEGYVRDAASEHLDMGLSSCYAYWLSNWPWWHPDLVEKGVEQLIKCVRTLNCSKEIKLLAEEKYHKLLLEVWGFHWSGQVEENYRQYEKEWVKLISSLPNLD